MSSARRYTDIYCAILNNIPLAFYQMFFLFNFLILYPNTFFTFIFFSSAKIFIYNLPILDTINMSNLNNLFMMIFS